MSVKIVLWSEAPRRQYQAQGIQGCEGLLLVPSAQAAAYQAQYVCRLLGEALDFGAALPAEERAKIEENAKTFLQARRLI